LVLIPNRFVKRVRSRQQAVCRHPDREYDQHVGTATPRRRLSKDARRAELLRAGEEVFSQRPFDEVSIDDIAAAGGISKNLLYHYFAGKRELYLAVITESAERMLAATEPDPSLEPIERLNASVDAHLAYAVAHDEGYIALMRGAGADEEVHAIVTAAQDRVVERTLATLPFPGGPPPEVALALRGWVGMVDHLTMHWLEHRHLPQDRVRELLVELFVSVIGAAATVGAR
jgi:AcrR family transcriptional regulator